MLAAQQEAISAFMTDIETDPCMPLNMRLSQQQIAPTAAAPK